jgi:hypothetical protein
MEAKQVADQQQILHRLTEQVKLRQQLTHAEKEIMDRTEKAQHALYEAQMRETKLNASEIAMAQSNVQGRIKLQEVEMALSSTTNELEQSLYQLSHAQQSHRTFGHENQTADARYQEAAASMQANMHHLQGESQVMARQLEYYKDEMCKNERAYHVMQGMAADQLRESTRAHEVTEQQLRHAMKTEERAEENATYWRHMSNTLNEKLHAESEAYHRNGSPDEGGIPSPLRPDPPPRREPTDKPHATFGRPPTWPIHSAPASEAGAEGDRSVKIKEADKVEVPAFPEITKLVHGARICNAISLRRLAIIITRSWQNGWLAAGQPKRWLS